MNWRDDRTWARAAVTGVLTGLASAVGAVTGNPEVAVAAGAMAQSAAVLAEAAVTNTVPGRDPSATDRGIVDEVRRRTGADDDRLAAGLALAFRLLEHHPLTTDEWLASFSRGPDAIAQLIVERAGEDSLGDVAYDPCDRTVIEVAREAVAQTYNATGPVLLAVLNNAMAEHRRLAVEQAALTSQQSGQATALTSAVERLDHLSAKVGMLRAHPLAHTTRLIIGNPPDVPPVFQPRAQAQDEIDTAWARAGNLAVVRTQVVRGDGGVGKSQLARHYFAASDARVRLWIDASSLDSLTSGYASGARELGLPGDNDAERAQAFMTWLRSTEASWLVVLDDLSLDPAEVSRWWPPRTRSGNTLVTTRRRDAGYDSTERTMVDLGVYTEPEAVDYVAARLAAHAADLPPGAAAQVASLVEALDRHPVALSLATAVIIDRQWTTTRYLRLLDDRTRTLADVLPGEDAPGRKTIAATWSIAVERAAELCSYAPAMADMVAFGHPTQTPRCLFTTEAARGYIAATIDPPEAVLITDDQADDALSALRRVSLISTGADRWSPVGVHALAQRAIRESMNVDRQSAAARALADAVAKNWPSVDTDPGIGVPLRAVVDHLIQVTELAVTPQNGIHPALLRAGKSLGQSGRPDLAVVYYDKLLRLSVASLGKIHRDTLLLRGEIAYWHAGTGNISRAIDESESLLEDQERILGRAHPTTFSTRRNVAWWKAELGNIADGVVFFEKLIDDMASVLDENHELQISVRQDLGYWRSELGDVLGGIRELRIAYEAQLQTIGPHHPDTLMTRHQLARRRAESGDISGGIEESRRLLVDEVRVLGPDHPYTLGTRGNIAWWLAKAGDTVGSLSEYSRLLSDRERVLGPDNPATLVTRSDIANWTAESGSIETGLRDLRAALSDQERVLGDGHPDTMTTRRRVAYWRGVSGDLSGGISDLCSLLDDQEPLFDGTPYVLAVRNDIVTLRTRTGQLADLVVAAGELEQLVGDSRKVLGNEHPDTVRREKELVQVQRDLVAQTLLVKLSVQATDLSSALASLDELVDGYKFEHPQQDQEGDGASGSVA